MAADMTFKANLIPNTSLGYSLGSSDRLWNIPGYLKLSGGTMTGTLLMEGRAADNPIVTRGITGSDGVGTVGGELYLNYNGGPVHFSTGGTAYVEDGTFYGIFNGNAATATKLSNTPNNNTTFLRGDNVWTNALANSFYSNASPGFNNTVAAGAWSYLRLNNGSNTWDVATRSDSRSGGLQFRPASINGDVGPYIQTNGAMIFNNCSNTAVDFSGAAMQIREFHYGGPQDNTWGNAPRLAWHWSNRVAAQIGLSANGWLYEAPSTGTSFYKLICENGGSYNILATQNVNKAGDTMTGPLSYQVSSINATATNNNISSAQYPTTFNILDSGGRIISRLESVVNSNGNIGSYWYVRNYNTSGNMVAQKGIAITMNKSGALTYGISDPANFRSALGINGTVGNANTPIYWNAGVPTATNNKLGAVNANGYWGMRGADNGDSWIRTTTSGLIPVQSGNKGSGHCALGTSTWYFSAAYIDTITSNKTYGAVWNDYAEYRESDITEPGRCIKETGNGDLILTTKRLEKGCEIVSDTFGFAIGESDICKTPTAAAGRVLAYPYESIEEFKNNIGQAVCSGPNGTVSIMTDQEVRNWPQCVIGTISEIPKYDVWHAGGEGEGSTPIQVNGRIWIRIR